MAGFNALTLEHGRIARGLEVSQSKKLMRGIKGIYSGRQATLKISDWERPE
jgi:hypothetical protein